MIIKFIYNNNFIDFTLDLNGIKFFKNVKLTKTIRFIKIIKLVLFFKKI